MKADWRSSPGGTCPCHSYLFAWSNAILLLYIKWWQFHFTSAVNTPLHWSLETNAVCPVDSVVVALWGKWKTILLSLQQRRQKAFLLYYDSDSYRETGKAGGREGKWHGGKGLGCNWTQDAGLSLDPWNENESSGDDVETSMIRYLRRGSHFQRSLRQKGCCIVFLPWKKGEQHTE